MSIPLLYDRIDKAVKLGGEGRLVESGIVDDLDCRVGESNLFIPKLKFFGVRVADFLGLKEAETMLRDLKQRSRLIGGSYISAVYMVESAWRYDAGLYYLVDNMDDMPELVMCRSLGVAMLREHSYNL